MKLQLNPSVPPQATSGAASAGKLPEAPEAVAQTGDGIRVSSVLEALDQTARIGRVAAAVQAGTYKVSSTATGTAIVRNALSGRN